MTSILPLSASDRDDWLPLWLGYLEFYEHPLTDAQTELTFARLIDPDVPQHAAIARDADSRATGFVHWLTHPSTWEERPIVYLEDLFTASEARGAGVGRALITTVTEWARAHELPQVYWVTQSTNATARALYDRVAVDTGFVRYEIEID